MAINMGNKQRTIWTVLFILIYPVFTFANTGVFYGAGNQVIPINNGKIQLVKEEVDIKLTVEKDSAQYDLPFIPMAHVTAKFYLKNVTEDNVSLQMGFPFLDLQGFGDEKEVLGRMDFRVISNGKQIPSELKEGLIEKKIDPEGMFKKVFAWDDSFAPGETKAVVVTYKLLMSVVSANSSDRGFDEEGEKYYELDKQFPALNYSFGYITKTAYTWKGPIEEAVFRLDAKELMNEFNEPSVFGKIMPDNISITRPIYLENMYPYGYQRQDGIYEWTFKEKVPEEGFSMNFVVFFVPSDPAEVKQYIAANISKLEGITKDEYVFIAKQYYSLILSRGTRTDKLSSDYFKDVRFINDKTRLVFEEDKKGITDILNRFDELIR